jgi:hypothetical protein
MLVFDVYYVTPQINESKYQVDINTEIKSNLWLKYGDFG